MYFNAAKSKYVQPKRQFLQMFNEGEVGKMLHYKRSAACIVKPVLTATLFICIQLSHVFSEGHNKNILGTLFRLQLIFKQRQLHQRRHTAQSVICCCSLTQSLIRLDIKRGNKSLHTYTKHNSDTKSHARNLNPNIPNSSIILLEEAANPVFTGCTHTATTE